MRRGTRVGQAYVAITADGSGINEEIVDSVDAAGDDIDKKGDEHGESYGEHFSEGFIGRLRNKFSKEISARLSTSIGEAGDAAGDEAGDRAGRSLGKRLTDSTRGLGDKIGSQLGDRIGDSIAERLEASLGRHASSIAAALEDAVSGNGRSGPRNDDDGGLGGLIGGMLGAGSRNNALNLFGKAIGGSISLMEKLRGITSSVFSEFQKGWAGAAEGASMFQKASAGAGAAGTEALASIGTAGPGAVVAIGAVIVAMSALVSVSSALLAIVTALASTILSALVGATLVLGGALTAATAAAGLLVVAFTSMTDAQRKFLSDAFHPLKAELTGLGQLLLTDLIPAFATWSANLQNALLLAAPAAQVMGAAFAQAGNVITAAFSGPGFVRLSQVLARDLPAITAGFSVALANFLNGSAGVFAALMPLVVRFANYLSSVTDRFAEWANSTAGQNAIVDFADRAVDSLKSLWNFVREFSGFIADVLFSPQAQNFGNGMFDSLAASFQRLRDKIDDGSLQRWFDQASKFGTQLWAVLVALANTFAALNNSGVLAGVGSGLKTMADIINVLNQYLGPLVDLIGAGLPYALAATLGPIAAVVTELGKLTDAAGGAMNLLKAIAPVGGYVADYLSGSAGSSSSSAPSIPTTPTTGTGINAAEHGLGPSTPNIPGVDLSHLISSGQNALNNTSISHGGTKKPPKYVNPYVGYANSLIKDGPKIAAQIRNAMLTVNKQVAAALRDASKAANAADVKSALTTTMSNITISAKQTVNTAQSALNSAAQSLANASSAKAAKAALQQVRKTQRDLKAAIENQKDIEKVAARLGKQKIVTSANVDRLLKGLKTQNATLADFARARSILANKIKAANDKLTDALALRNDFASAVTDAAKAFGALTTAQAQVIDGVEQSLAYKDITGNLQERLDKIRKFQSNLRILLAQGLSDAAYKQLLDAGVEAGSAYADALVAGGQGAVSSVNQLVSQYDSVADQLGIEASKRLYQAGVDAAQGLVDGLNSLSAQLDAAATRLGNSIAKAVKKALGIKSPSRVMIAAMDYVGDGIEYGLDNQHRKVGSAAARLAGQVAMSPEATAYAATQPGGVSGNSGDPRFRDLIIQTPTEQPKAVAMEVLNEVTGRL